MEICLVCSSDKDNNGLVVCSECNTQEGSACGACGFFYEINEEANDGYHSQQFCEAYEEEGK